MRLVLQAALRAVQWVRFSGCEGQVGGFTHGEGCLDVNSPPVPMSLRLQDRTVSQHLLGSVQVGFVQRDDKRGEKMRRNAADSDTEQP